MRKQVPLHGYGDSIRQSKATHSNHRVQYFHVSKQWYGYQCSGLFMVLTGHAFGCTQELYEHHESLH